VSLYLIIQWQFAENGDVFGPFDQEEQLLFHRFANIVDGSHPFAVQIVIVDG
jgi:precorrin-6x reductase